MKAVNDMMQLLAKGAVWLVAGVAMVYFAVPLTGFQAASPWQYSVQATGNVVATATESRGTVDDPLQLSIIGPPNEAGNYGTVQVNETLDLGVLSFLIIIYVGGTFMGRVLKKRPKPDLT